MSKSEITVQSTNYIQNVVYQAKTIITINDKISYNRYKINSITKFEHDFRYFKRLELQYNFKLDKDQADILLRATIKKIKKQFLFMKEIKSKYILKYTSLVFCYPYACLYHQPIINNLQNFLKEKKSFCFKLSLMIAIIKGLDDLQRQEIDVYPLNPKTILITSNQNQEPQIAFSQAFLFNNKKQNYISVNIDQNNLYQNRYLPPESINHYIYLRKSHCWCLGAIILILIKVSFNRNLKNLRIQVNLIGCGRSEIEIQNQRCRYFLKKCKVMWESNIELAMKQLNNYLN